MQPLTFPCAACGRLMGVGMESTGRPVRCPHCQQVVTAPENETLARALLAIQKLKRKVHELELANKALEGKELSRQEPIAIIGFG